MRQAADARLAEVIGAVGRRMLADRGFRRVALLDDGSPEAALALRLLTDSLGAATVVRVRASAAEVESVLQILAVSSPVRAAEELRRARARVMAGALAAHPGNKTALLLGGELPPEPFLPLGDLYASEVEALEGGWSAPDEVRRLVAAAGGITVVDAALRQWIDRRDPAGSAGLPPEAAATLRRALDRGRAGRCHPRIVPKLGSRTLYVDLFE